MRLEFPRNIYFGHVRLVKAFNYHLPAFEPVSCVGLVRVISTFNPKAGLNSEGKYIKETRGLVSSACIDHIIPCIRPPRQLDTFTQEFLLIIKQTNALGNYSSFYSFVIFLAVPWTPIVTHANEAWEQRHHPNLHFVFYEDMLKVN